MFASSKPGSLVRCTETRPDTRPARPCVRLATGTFSSLVAMVCCEPMTETSRFDYYIAAPTSQPVPEGMEAFTVPAATWAVFTCVGPMPGAIQEMQKRIATEWLPTSGYEFGNAPDIEAYFDEDGTKPDVRSEIWVPVVKKA